MNIFIKIGAILILFLGEAVSVYAEMVAARAHAASQQSFFSIFIKSFILIGVAGGLLILGYMIGFKCFKNIWLVSAMSITSILIMEPLVGYLILHQLPTRGALLGLIFGAIGFVFTFI